MSGFLPFEGSESKFSIGQIIDTVVTKLSSNGRVCSVSEDSEKQSNSFVRFVVSPVVLEFIFFLQFSEISSVSSILPGALAQCLITSVKPDGINLQFAGFFDGTVDLFHLPEKSFKAGKKVKARVLYNYSTSPPKFALALSEHVVHLRPRLVSCDGEEKILQEAYPIGTILDAVKVLRVEKERGLIVKVGDQEGFVHVCCHLKLYALILMST